MPQACGAAYDAVCRIRQWRYIRTNQGYIRWNVFMKALLVYPEWPDTYWSFKHALPFEGKKSVFPPLGLLTVASLLPKTWEPGGSLFVARATGAFQDGGQAIDTR